MPLYRCADCGFVTTASEAHAVLAHETGSPRCPGEIELIADFARTPAVVQSPRKRRRSHRSAVDDTRTSA
jgi:hypothetical protein